MQLRHSADNSIEDDASRRACDDLQEIGIVDPIIEILLRGDALTVSQAEEEYLDANLRQVIELVESPISDAEFRAHPLITLLLSHGSRDWEDSLS
jgi:hypothetical protein